MRPLLAPDTLWLRVDALFGELKAWPRIALKTDKLPPKAGNTNLDYHALPDLAVQAQHKSRWITCGALSKASTAA